MLLNTTTSIEELDEAVIRGSPGLDRLMVAPTRDLRKNVMMLHGVDPPTNPLIVKVTLAIKSGENPADCSSVGTCLQPN